MIYLTGDTHGRFERIGIFCDKMQTSRDDILIILGDAGINFHAGTLDMVVGTAAIITQRRRSTGCKSCSMIMRHWRQTAHAEKRDLCGCDQ